VIAGSWFPVMAGRGAANLDAKKAVRPCHSYSERDFNDVWGSVKDYLLIETLDNDGKSQGHAVVEMVRKYPADTDGAFAMIGYCACSDQYYDWWTKNELRADCYHHFCRMASLKACVKKIGTSCVGPIHVLKWTPLLRREAEEYLTEWGVSLTVLKKKKVTLPSPLSLSPKKDEDENKETQKSKGKHRSSGHEDDDDEHSGGHVIGRSGRRRRTHQRRDEGRSGEESESPQKPKSSRPGPKDGKGRHGPDENPKKRKAEEAALDALIDEDPKDSDAPKEVKQAAEERLAMLRSHLLKKKDARTGQNPGAVLASRALGVAEALEKKVKKEVDPSTLNLLRHVMKKEKHSKKGDHDDESGSDSSQESEDNEELGVGLVSKGDPMGRQRKLRSLSQKKPGKLMQVGYTTMHDQLGTHFGSLDTKTRALSPVAVRYLLSFAIPQFQGGISPDKYRELRTLASAADMLVEGKIGEAGDMLLQRFKALLMTLRDGTDRASRWLELLPMDDMPTVSSSREEYVARTLAVQQAKNEQLLHRMAVG